MDAERDLAIVLSPAEGAGGRRPRPDDAAPDDSPGLTLLEDLFDWITQRPIDDLPEALGRLARELGGSGGALVRFEEHLDPAVVAAWGDVAGIPRTRALQELASEARNRARDGGPWVAVHQRAAVGISAAFRIGPGAASLGLFLWGHPDRLLDRPASLRLLVRLIDRVHTRVPIPAPERPVDQAGTLRFPPGFLTGQSARMKRLYEEMGAIAEGDLPVLLVGETGVGKEHLARTLHLSSPRRDHPFVAINCAAIPSELLESELFGIARGVATGVAERPGKFQEAAGGTILLDEIAEMPMALQSKLLRALEEREIVPVGGRPLRLAARVLAATNVALRERAERGEFRRDLYYRLAGYVLRVPPLRERQEDVAGLVEHFLHAAARETRKRVRGVTVRALRSLVGAAWPGNVRELRHEVNRLVYLCPEGGVIDTDLLSESVLAARPPEPPQGSVASLELAPHVEEVERRVIGVALARTRGNRSQAARALGLSRNGLAAKIRKLGLEG